MEQIEQLKSMRDAAKERIEEAIRKIETSPDAKLVNSLTSLIDELEESLGIASATTKLKKPAAPKASDPISDAAAVKKVEGATPKPVGEEAGSKAQSNPAKPIKADNKEMSLEDSLEAELLGGDLGKS